MIAKIAPMFEQFCAGVLDTVAKAHEALTKRVAAVEDKVEGASAERSAAAATTAERIEALEALVKENAANAAALLAAGAEEVKALREALHEITHTVATVEALNALDERCAKSMTQHVELMAQADLQIAERCSALTQTVHERLAALPAVPSAEEVAALVPRPADGASVSRDDVRAMVEEVARGFQLPTAESIAEALDAKHVARWALDFERRAQDVLQRAVDRMPKPRDGEDGLGFDDIEFEYDGKRTWTIAVQRGERRKAQSFKVPAMLYQKIFSETALYDQGDVVTWAGSAWVALKDAPQGTPGRSHDWQLLVKKGRDGSNSAK